MYNFTRFYVLLFVFCFITGTTCQETEGKTDSAEETVPAKDSTSTSSAEVPPTKDVPPVAPSQPTKKISDNTEGGEDDDKKGAEENVKDQDKKSDEKKDEKKDDKKDDNDGKSETLETTTVAENKEPTKGDIAPKQDVAPSSTTTETTTTKKGDSGSSTILASLFLTCLSIVAVLV